MEKGKCGLTFKALAMLGFILGFINLGIFIVYAIALIIYEKNDYLTTDLLRAFILRILFSIVTALSSGFGIINIGGIFSGLFDGGFNFYNPLSGIAAIGAIVFGLLTFAAGVIYIIYTIIALVNISKGRPYYLPGVNQLADWALGIVREQQRNYKNHSDYYDPNKYRQNYTNKNNNNNNNNNNSQNYYNQNNSNSYNNNSNYQSSPYSQNINQNNNSNNSSNNNQYNPYYNPDRYSQSQYKPYKSAYTQSSDNPYGNGDPQVHNEENKDIKIQSLNNKDNQSDNIQN